LIIGWIVYPLKSPAAISAELNAAFFGRRPAKSGGFAGVLPDGASCSPDTTLNTLNPQPSARGRVFASRKSR
jgi:hypothetical protein